MIVYASASKRESQLGRFMQVQKSPKSHTGFGVGFGHFEQFRYVTTKSDKNTCRATIKNTA